MFDKDPYPATHKLYKLCSLQDEANEPEWAQAWAWAWTECVSWVLKAVLAASGTRSLTHFAETGY